MGSIVEGRRVSGTAGLRSVVAIGRFSGAIYQLRTDCQAIPLPVVKTYEETNLDSDHSEPPIPRSLPVPLASGPTCLDP